MTIVANDNSISNSIIVSVKEVASMTSLSRTAISKKRGADKFPLPVSLGEKRIGFVRAEIETWISDRVNARRRAA